MKIIVLHDRYSNNPVIVRPDSIVMIQKYKDNEEEYSNIVVGTITMDVKETIGTVMTKIKKAESEGEE